MSTHHPPSSERWRSRIGALALVALVLLGACTTSAPSGGRLTAQRDQPPGPSQFSETREWTEVAWGGAGHATLLFARLPTDFVPVRVGDAEFKGALSRIALLVAPEPVTQGVAATFAVLLWGYLGFEFFDLIQAYVRLSEDAARATTFAELREAGERFGRIIGPNSVRILVLLLALSGDAGRDALASNENHTRSARSCPLIHEGHVCSSPVKVDSTALVSKGQCLLSTFTCRNDMWSGRRKLALRNADRICSARIRWQSARRPETPNE